MKAKIEQTDTSSSVRISIEWGEDTDLAAKLFVAVNSGLLRQALQGVTLDSVAVAKIRGDLHMPPLGYF